MPELPQVEHAAITLRRWLAGHRIVRAAADPTRIFRGSDPAEFAAKLAGRTLEQLSRRGKRLLFTFDRDVGVTSHLGMSGRWVRRSEGESPPGHSRARLVLAEGSVIHYVDPRMFGRIAVAKASELEHLPEIADLGPDALSDSVDAERLREVLGSRSRPMKMALMDQTVIAGLGNILVTEALFRAHIHPDRTTRSLDARDLEALAEGIREAVEHGLANDGEGDEIAYLQDGAGVENPFLIYGRAGEACPRCGRPLESSQHAGRTTVFCRRCQPPPRKTKAR